jgi:cytosylglucuronate decarboxylase
MNTSASRKRYLFIRLLEACNSHCFMCGYARSRDSYRFTLAEFETILPQAQTLGVEYVRFTGGEPLLHKDITALIHAGANAGMRMSVITNGYLLSRMFKRLLEAGLAQVVVSIDSASASCHDSYRRTPGLFDRCIAGLKMARDHGVLTRVNTVVGSHNYAEMPRLQQRLTEIGVQQWELSAIKLDRQVVYPDPGHVRAVCDPVYEANPGTMLVPMGKRFYGDTAAEQELYFVAGITPRPSPPQCHLVGDVIYIDAKTGLGFGCSLLPHRKAEESGGGVRMRTEGGWTLDVADFHEHVSLFRSAGPTQCRGCSTTAAGYSDDIARSGTIVPWHF